MVTREAFWRTVWAAGLVGILGYPSTPAVAGGKKKKPVAQPPAFSEPRPTRQVRVRPVTTIPFQLPTGSLIDIGNDLDSIFQQVITQSTHFSPTVSSAEPDACGVHLELRAALTTLELNAWEIGLKIGYSFDGELGETIPGIAGTLNTRIGTLAMDFSVWECSRGTCSAIAANTQDHLTAQLTGAIGIDLDLIVIGPSFVRNTEFGKMIRKVMQQGVQGLERSSRLNELAWRAEVVEVDGGGQTLTFNKGLSSRLANNQKFTVYAPHAATGICNVYEPVAEIHTVRVDPVSSVAQVHELRNARGPQVGDIVLIRMDERP